MKLKRTVNPSPSFLFVGDHWGKFFGMMSLECVTNPSPTDAGINYHGQVLCYWTSTSRTTRFVSYDSSRRGSLQIYQKGQTSGLRVLPLDYIKVFDERNRTANSCCVRAKICCCKRSCCRRSDEAFKYIAHYHTLVSDTLLFMVSK